MDQLTQQLEGAAISTINHNAVWLRPQDIDITKVRLSRPIKLAFSHTLRKVLYEYPHGTESFVLAPSLSQEGYITVTSVYAQGDDKDKKRHICRMVLKDGNQEHQNLLQIMQNLCTIVEQMVYKGSQALELPIKEDNGSTMLYAELIESNEGIIYSKAHDERGVVDITTIKQSQVRPCFIFSHTEGAQERKKLRVQISQMYVVNISPLSVYDVSPLIAAEEET